MTATTSITCTCGFTFVDEEALRQHATAKNHNAQSRGEPACHERVVDEHGCRLAVSARSCPLCMRKPFPSLEGLRHHVQDKHSKALSVVDREILRLENAVNIQALRGSADAGSDKRFRCLSCKKKCRSMAGLCQHTLTAHGEQETIDVLRLSLGETAAPAPVLPVALPICEAEEPDRVVQREEQPALVQTPTIPKSDNPWDMVTSALSGIEALKSAHRSYWTLLLSTLSKQYLQEVGFPATDALHDGDGPTAQTRSDDKVGERLLPHRRTPSEKADIIRRLIRDVD